MRPKPDVVILTGDVVDEGTPAEYETARALLGAIDRPLLAIPGNHDERQAFRACFAGQAYPDSSGPLHLVEGGLGPVRILGFDITVPGAHHGDIDDAAADWLAAALAREPERPTLVMMHQPPVESGIACIDAYRCLRGERMAEIVRRFPAIERIVCGHIHRFMQVRFGGTMLCAAPSTTTAIALRLAPEAEPASFVEPPALLLHHWREGAGLVTHHVPIGTFPGPLPFF
jgi:3',5'-cyclic-AMP phosphodiesterase